MCPLSLFVANSNPIILTIEIEKPQLPVIRSVFIVVILQSQSNPPTGCDHLRAHLILLRRTQSRIRKLSLLNQPLGDLVFGHAQALCQIAASPIDHLFLIELHGREVWNRKRSNGFVCSLSFGVGTVPR